MGQSVFLPLLQDLYILYRLAGRRDEAPLVLAELEADPTPWDT